MEDLECRVCREPRPSRGFVCQSCTEFRLKLVEMKVEEVKTYLATLHAQTKTRLAALSTERRPPTLPTRPPSTHPPANSSPGSPGPSSKSSAPPLTTRTDARTVAEAVKAVQVLIKALKRFKTVPRGETEAALVTGLRSVWNTRRQVCLLGRYWLCVYVTTLDDVLPSSSPSPSLDSPKGCWTSYDGICTVTTANTVTQQVHWVHRTVV